MQQQATLPRCSNPFWEIGPTWVDGERGRTLRRLWDPNDYGETVAADMMEVVAATEVLLRRQGLQFAGGANRYFQGLIDFIAARLESPYGALEWRRPATAKPKGWTDDDERIWLEWLDMRIFTPESWTHWVMEAVFGRRGSRIWEEGAGRWREEWRTYAPYYVARSRDILQEIDPRPWEEESAVWTTGTSGEEERR
jgi:hypothetical protein